MKKNVIGDRVKEARKTSQPQITQVDLAARLEMLGMKADHSVISKIESGQRPVYDYELIALSKALKVSTSWLLSETNKK